MNKTFLSVLSSSLAFVALVFIAGWFFWDTKNPGPAETHMVTVDAVALEPISQSPTIDKFHVFDNGDPNDFSQGREFFGDQDKLGISKPILDAYPNRGAEFLSIANRHEERKNYLASHGRQINPQDHWIVTFLMSGAVNDEQRVTVMALSGHNEPRMNGAIGMHVGGCVVEIWRINPPGTAPTLLDRSMERTINLNTLAEAPEEPLPELPPIDFPSEPSGLKP